MEIRGQGAQRQPRDIFELIGSMSDQRTLHLIATMREVLCGGPPRS
jgi:hypothetical protein